MLTGLKLCSSAMMAKVRAFFEREDGEVNIVAIVVLIGIAVLLAIVFRGFITNLLNTLFGQINNSAANALAPPPQS